MAPKKDPNPEIKFVLRLGPSVPAEQDDRPQQMDFEFVHGKDKESRRRVRKHVMRGWRQNKKRHFDAEVEKTRGQLDRAGGDSTPELSCGSSGGSPPSLCSYGVSNISSPSFGESDADFDWDDQVLQHYDHLEREVTLRNVNGGWRANSVDATPTTSNQEQKSLDNHAFNELSEATFGFSSNTKFNLFRDLALSRTIEDPALFQPLLLSSAHHHTTLRGRESTPEFLDQKLEAIRLMKEALFDPSKSTSDEMIQTAVYIASDEVCPSDLMHEESHCGNYEVAPIHLSGIRRMIQLRNASPDAPEFNHRLEVQLLGAECLIPTALDSILYDPSDLPSATEQLIDFFTDLQCLTSTSQSRPQIPPDSLLHALLSTPPDTSTPNCSHHLQESGQLASLFYICSALLDFESAQSSCSTSSPSSSYPKSQSFISGLNSQLLDLVSYSNSEFQDAAFPPPKEMLVWTLLSGLDSDVFDDRGRGWRVARLMFAAKMVGVEQRRMFAELMVEALGAADGQGRGFDADEVRREVWSAF